MPIPAEAPAPIPDPEELSVKADGVVEADIRDDAGSWVALPAVLSGKVCHSIAY
jgi:hypothetical protein